MSINDEFNRFIRDNLALSQKDISVKVKSREWLINRVTSKIKEKIKKATHHPLKSSLMSSNF